MARVIRITTIAYKFCSHQAPTHKVAWTTFLKILILWYATLGGQCWWRVIFCFNTTIRYPLLLQLINIYFLLVT